MEDQEGLKVIRSLVIEDNPTNLELMIYILSAFGHTTITAVDGEAGIQAALECRPSIILCDVHLPKLDGYEVASRLKAHPELRHVPLIAVTALAMVGDRERLLAAGFDGYIAKPISPENFTRQVEEYLKEGDRLGKRLEERSHEETAAEAPAEPTRGLILIINHSDSNIELARMLLEPSGFEVRSTGDSAELFADTSLPPPDLVIYDVHGYEDRGGAFMRRMMDDERICSLPLILISSSGWRERDRDAHGEYGHVKHMVRPIDPVVLMTVVDSCLRTGLSDGSKR